MVKAFKFARLPEILFKNGGLSELPAVIKRFGDPVLLVTGKESFIASERGKKLLKSLKENDISFFKVSIPGEPSPSDIDEAIETCRDMSIKLVVAIGGGSVLDAGKAVSAMLTVQESVKHYLEGVGHKEHPGTKIPFIAMPTTSGTGSEASKNAVISEVGSSGFKKSLRHDNFVPDIAILDPELTLNCPVTITANSGMDCFTQLTEAFLSDKASVYTDAFAREGLKAIKSSLVKAVKNGDDLEARTGMSFAAFNSGVCLANAGLGTVHGFASVIGGKYDIPHGLVCGTLMAPANRVNVRELRAKDPDSCALHKYAELGRMFLDNEGQTDDYYIDGFVDYIYRLTQDLRIPDLKDYGLLEEDVKGISEKAGNKNNPFDLSKENRMEILAERVMIEGK